MIPLNGERFPNSKAELAAALDESLRRYVRKDKPVVEVSSRVFPYLDDISINFDGAEIKSDLPPPPKLTGETKDACEAAALNISARGVLVHGAPLNVQLQAKNIVFHQGRSENGELLLLVHFVRTGNLTISAVQLDLEAAIEKVAKHEALKHGVTIEKTRVAFRARGPRSLSVDIRLEAKKLLFRAKIDISGQIHVSDDFVARVSNLTCRGEGPIGSMACAALDPALQKVDGASFPLMSLPLGEIKLHDIRIAVADTIEITADFGSAS